jgi:hypothetical protein
VQQGIFSKELGLTRAIERLTPSHRSRAWRPFTSNMQNVRRRGEVAARMRGSALLCLCRSRGLGIRLPQRLGGFAPFIATWLIGVTGSNLAPSYYLIAAATITFLVVLRIPETAFRPLR